ncbi:MAG: hypothetical protein H6819_08435 [Phycisphaerales bacterium]|nr:hypothetical protein [Phycisphaerales bacterium]MCB9854167.1 hypothetical protein [Phycisphaerales bacterium]MCB9864697.1 hypothetical protein [Phycisphaerales bacterium]
MMTFAVVLSICVCVGQTASGPSVRSSGELDAADSIQREIDRQIDGRRPPIESSPVIRLPQGRFVLKRPITFRATWGGRLVGQGYGTVLEADFSESDRGKPMIDLTGCTRFQIADLRIVGGPPTNPTNRATPGTGLLLGRSKGESAGFHVIERVHFEGRFGVAAMANIASEVNVFRDCVFSNHEPPARWTEDRVPIGGYCVLVANHNFQNLLDAGISTNTMLELSFENCSFHLTSLDKDGKPADGGAAVMVVGAQASALGDVFFTGGGGYVQNATACVLLYAEGTTGQLEQVVLEKMRWEADSCEYGLLGVSALPRIIGPVVWRDCSVYIARQFTKFTGMATGFCVEQTRILRSSKRLPEFSGAAIEADRSRNWNVRLWYATGWDHLVEVGKAMSWDRFEVPSKSSIKVPDTNVNDVKIDSVKHD